MGLDDLRLLFRRLRDVHRGQGRPGGERPRQSRSSRQPGRALSEGPLRARDDPRGQPRQISAPASDPEEPPRACQLGCRAADDGPQVPGSTGGVWPGGGWRHQYRAARHGGVLRPRQAGAARSRHTALRRQHHAMHVHGGGRLQTLVRNGRAAWSVRGPRTSRCHPAHRRQHRRQPPDSLAASRGQPRQDTDRRRPAGHQDRHAGRPPSAAQAALGSRAHQRPHPHRHSPRVDQARLHRRAYDRLRRIERVGPRLCTRAGGRDYRSFGRRHSQDGVSLRARQTRRSSAGRWA